jgi:guanylate kinase
MLLEIDINGAKRVKDLHKDAYLIVILPPDIDSLRERILKRGEMSNEDLEERLSISKNEISEFEKIKDSITFTIINDKLETAFSDLISFFEKILE